MWQQIGSGGGGVKKDSGGVEEDGEGVYGDNEGFAGVESIVGKRERGQRRDMVVRVYYNRCCL